MSAKASWVLHKNNNAVAECIHCEALSIFLESKKLSEF